MNYQQGIYRNVLDNILKTTGDGTWEGAADIGAFGKLDVGTIVGDLVAVLVGDAVGFYVVTA